MLWTPAQQRGSFITVIYTCPKGVQSKLIWKFFNDSWDWNVPSVFNAEITSFILQWEPFRISLCSFFLLKDNSLLTIFSPTSVCKIAFRRMGISLRKPSTLPSAVLTSIWACKKPHTHFAIYDKMLWYRKFAYKAAKPRYRN